MTYKEWCEKHQITVDLEYRGVQTAARNWEHHAWACILHRPAYSSFKVGFTQGMALTKPPEIQDIVQGLAFDVRAWDDDDQSVDEVLDVKMTLKACLKKLRDLEAEARNIKEFAGDDLDELLQCEED